MVCPHCCYWDVLKLLTLTVLRDRPGKGRVAVVLVSVTFLISSTGGYSEMLRVHLLTPGITRVFRPNFRAEYPHFFYYDHIC